MLKSPAIAGVFAGSLTGRSTSTRIEVSVRFDYTIPEMLNREALPNYLIGAGALYYIKEPCPADRAAALAGQQLGRGIRG